jgi:uncharacterized membrane protein
MDYLIIKWIHVLSATVIVGIGFGTAFYKWMADRSGNLRTIADVSGFVIKADWWFTTPAIVVQPITGLMLAHQAEFPITSGWVAWALLLYFITGAFWLPVLWLQYRMHSLASEALMTGSTLPKEYQSRARQWFWLGIPAFSAMIAVYALMIFKP